MDWHSISFEPNLKFVLDLNEDLKTKYFEHHKKAKYLLENFSHSLQHVFLKHQKLLANNIELTIINEKLKQIINKNEFNHQQLCTKNNHQLPQLLQADSNCNLKILNNISNTNTQSHNEIQNKSIILEKENINKFVPIYSSDFLSDDESFEKQSSPSMSLVTLYNSPIISKSKRLCLKKNDLISNASRNVTSSNVECKPGLSKNSFIINNSEIKNQSHDSFEKVDNKKSVKSIESTCQIPTEDIQNKNEGLNILSVSKTNYGKSEFLKNGKKLRQTKLTLKKLTPVIDVSKYDPSKCCNLNESEIKDKKENTNDETFFNIEFVCENRINHDEGDKRANNILSSEIECYNFKRVLSNENLLTNKEIKNISLKDDEFVETSPIQIENSKLRNKLNLNKKSNANEMQGNSLSPPKKRKRLNLKNNVNANIASNKNSIIIENASKSPQFKNRNLKTSAIIKEKHKKFVHQNVSNDETYFSLIEANKGTKDTIISNIKPTKFADKINPVTPPAKKILLNSFDEIPGRTIKSPEYAYKESPVRNKVKKCQLPGWCCRQCEKWYSHLPDEEKQKRKDECSKHRGKYKADILTPESFWNPVFEDTNLSFS